MKRIIQLEELAMFGLAIYVLIAFHAAAWWYPLLLLGPDISMIGYVAGNKVGAFCYNFFHHKGIAIIVFVTGMILKNETVELTGVILFGHSSMDRMMGYGLKLKEGFKFTHLGVTGKK
jgi:hypothetical protein